MDGFKSATARPTHPPASDRRAASKTRWTCKPSAKVAAPSIDGAPARTASTITGAKDIKAGKPGIGTPGSSFEVGSMCVSHRTRSGQVGLAQVLDPIVPAAP